MTDAERIWLEPECCAEPRVGRTWCSVNEWTCCPAGECDAPQPTEYVRADLVAAREAAAAEAMRAACADYCHGRTSSRSYGSWADAFEAAERGIRALPLPAPDALARALDQARAEVAAERDEMWNRIQRVQEHLSLPVDCTAQRIIEAIEDLRAGEREACASIEVRVTVPDGAGEWSPLEAWEEALLALNEAFRAAIRARGKEKQGE